MITRVGKCPFSSPVLLGRVTLETPISFAGKSECAAEIKFIKYCAFHSTSGPDGGTLPGAFQ